MVHNVMWTVVFIGCLLLMAGCSTEDATFIVEQEESNVVEYAFGGGELGAEWHEITIRGDGQVSYRYVYPNVGDWPQAEFTQPYTLSIEDTQRLFQGLVDAGLYTLETNHAGGADIPQTTISASLNGRDIEVSLDGTPDDPIHSQIVTAIEQVRLAHIDKVAIHVTPEANYYAYSEFTPDGLVQGGHISEGFVHMEEETIPHEQVVRIWEDALRLNPGIYPVESTAMRDCTGCNIIHIQYADGLVMHLEWPFGEAYPDPDVQTLVQSVVDNVTGGW